MLEKIFGNKPKIDTVVEVPQLESQATMKRVAKLEKTLEGVNLEALKTIDQLQEELKTSKAENAQLNRDLKTANKNIQTLEDSVDDLKDSLFWNRAAALGAIALGTLFVYTNAYITAYVQETYPAIKPT